MSASVRTPNSGSASPIGMVRVKFAAVLIGTTGVGLNAIQGLIGTRDLHILHGEQVSTGD